MRCILSMLLCAVFAFIVTAAPAPVYKPRASKVWITGWNAPVDPVGDCRFDRSGEELTITLTGKPHSDSGRGNLDGPRLLRDVSGDFDMQVRVGGDFAQANLGGKMGERVRRAGVRLTVGKVTQERGISALAGVRGPTLLFRGELPNDTWAELNRLGYLASWRVHFRMIRRGGSIEHFYSEDGKKWIRNGIVAVGLTQKVKIGVFAEATASGTFQAVFDEFQLTPLK